LDGFLNLLKPPGLTSHDVVEQVRALFPDHKVGHGGTLDPGAAGVLPVLLGKATKLSSYLVDFPKIYRAELFLGLTTDTADSSGKIIAQKNPFSFKSEEIERVLNSFTGEIQQIPPMFAAIKQKGKKLYQYAREGITVERKPRTVNIYYLKLIDYFPPERIILEVKCSKGTYIRTLCSQIGDALGCGGHMSFLLRKEVGEFLISQTHLLEDLINLCNTGTAEQLLRPLDFPFRKADGLLLSQEGTKYLFHGRFLFLKELQDKSRNAVIKPVDEKIVPVYTTEREFVGLARWKFDSISGFTLKPEKMIKLF
jgi:tRNA pseudouridine55 synthase